MDATDRAALLIGPGRSGDCCGAVAAMERAKARVGDSINRFLRLPARMGPCSGFLGRRMRVLRARPQGSPGSLAAAPDADPALRIGAQNGEFAVFEQRGAGQRQRHQVASVHAILPTAGIALRLGAVPVRVRAPQASAARLVNLFAFSGSSWMSIHIRATPGV